MWILTPDGFYSAVAHFDDPELTVVRSRVLADSNLLRKWVVDRRKAAGDKAAAKEVKVEAYRGSDYPWRVIITKAEWAAFLAEQTEKITYTNFKNEVTKRQGYARHDVYSRVWSVLLSLEKLPGALTNHSKRAVTHPRFKGGTPPIGSFADLPPASEFGNHKAADQILGEGVHHSCTAKACVAPLNYPACHEKVSA